MAKLKRVKLYKYGKTTRLERRALARHRAGKGSFAEDLRAFPPGTPPKIGGRFTKSARGAKVTRTSAKRTVKLDNRVFPAGKGRSRVSLPTAAFNKMHPRDKRGRFRNK